jgi:hypothetical protein
MKVYVNLQYHAVTFPYNLDTLFSEQRNKVKKQLDELTLITSIIDCKSPRSGCMYVFFANATTCSLWTSWSPLPVVAEV